MKTRTYTSIDQRLFCPSCHQEIVIPVKGLTGATFMGTLKLGCGKCKKGTVIVDCKKKQENENIS